MAEIDPKKRMISPEQWEQMKLATLRRMLQGVNRAPMAGTPGASTVQQRGIQKPDQSIFAIARQRALQQSIMRRGQ